MPLLGQTYFTNPHWDMLIFGGVDVIKGNPKMNCYESTLRRGLRCQSGGFGV